MGCRKPVNLIGTVQGYLTVLGPAEKGADGRSQWNCFCAGCRKIKPIKHGDLMGKKMSCGCRQRKYPEDITDMMFGKLKAVRREDNKRFGKDQKARAMWYCECTCGGSTISTHNNLTRYRSLSCGKNYSCRIRADHTDTWFGWLYAKEIIQLADDDPNRNQNYLCVCKCEREIEVRINALKGGQYSCGCSRLGSNNMNWKGIGKMPGSCWGRIVASAEERNIPVLIDMQDAYDQFEKQQEKCAYTQRPLDFAYYNGRPLPENTASLDRIDSDKGYELGNIQWTDKRINVMKMDSKEDVFYKDCLDTIVGRPDLFQGGSKQELLNYIVKALGL